MGQVIVDPIFVGACCNCYSSSSSSHSSTSYSRSSWSVPSGSGGNSNSGSVPPSQNRCYRRFQAAYNCGWTVTDLGWECTDSAIVNAGEWIETGTPCTFVMLIEAGGAGCQSVGGCAALTVPATPSSRPLPPNGCCGSTSGSGSGSNSGSNAPPPMRMMAARPGNKKGQCYSHWYQYYNCTLGRWDEPRNVLRRCYTEEPPVLGEWTFVESSSYGDDHVCLYELVKPMRGYECGHDDLCGGYVDWEAPAGQTEAPADCECARRKAD